MTCPKCDRPITEAELPTGHKQNFNADPSTDGNALIFNGRAIFLSGPALFDARRRGIPVYIRHGVVCPNHHRRIE